jgi:hypothetical protein
VHLAAHGVGAVRRDLVDAVVVVDRVVRVDRAESYEYNGLGAYGTPIAGDAWLAHRYASVPAAAVRLVKLATNLVSAAAPVESKHRTLTS